MATTILILNSVAKVETTSVNGWSSIRTAGDPGNGLFVRAAVRAVALTGSTPQPLRSAPPNRRIAQPANPTGNAVRERRQRATPTDAC